MARFLTQQPTVTVNTIGDYDYIYICLNEREGTTEQVPIGYNESATEEKYFEYEYDELVVESGTIDIEDVKTNPNVYLYYNQKNKIHNKISNVCEGIIHNGFDVELSDGLRHFSLTSNDQLNIFGLQAMIANGQSEIEYHSDGQPCKFYSVDDANKIIRAAMTFKTYNTTYCNALNMWIKNTTSIDELNAIYYGIEIPEQYQTEVLKSLLASK